jgi:dTDP-4-dehydrorhamnose reductase
VEENQERNEVTVLITGANGQLGTALAEFFPDAVFTSRSELDLLSPDVEAIITKIDPDVIINCAAIVGKVDHAEDHPIESIEVNAVAVHRMLSAMRDPTGFIQISSDYVNADNVYGLTKRLAETMVRRHGGLTIRTSWLFGNGNNWVRWTLKNHAKLLTVVNDQVARPTYARDLAGAIKGAVGRHGLLQIQNSGPPVSWYQYARKICEMTGLDCAFMPIATNTYQHLHPEVADRPRDSVMMDYPGMRDWRLALGEYLENS